MKTTDEQKEKMKIYYDLNKEKVLKKQKENYEKNKDIIIEKQKKCKTKNADKVREYQKKYRQLNKDKRKIYIELNFDKIKKQSTDWIKENKIEKQKYDNEYRIKNKEKINQRLKARRKTDVLYRIKESVGASIRVTRKKGGFIKNNTRTEQILGCIIPEFKIYIES